MKIEEQIQPTASELTHRFQDVQQRATEAAKNVSEVTDRFVHDNPWKTVALGAIIGCFIGFLIGHRD